MNEPESESEPGPASEPEKVPVAQAPRARVARLADIPHGSGHLVELEDGREVALFRATEQTPRVFALAPQGAPELTAASPRVAALDAVCPHRGAILAFGEARGGMVYCPLHAWGFRLGDGTCPEFPGVGVATYRVTVEGEDVFLEL